MVWPAYILPTRLPKKEIRTDVSLARFVGFWTILSAKEDACRRTKVWVANVEARQIREVREKAVSQQWWRPKCSSTPRDRARSALDHRTCTTCERRELLEWRCFVRTNCLISACYPNRNWLVKVQWRVLRSIMEPHHMLASPDLSFSSQNSLSRKLTVSNI